MESGGVRRVAGGAACRCIATCGGCGSLEDGEDERTERTETTERTERSADEPYPSSPSFSVLLRPSVMGLTPAATGMG